MIACIYHRQISLEQYIRRKCSAVDHGINLRLVFDYQQYLQERFYLAWSVLKSFYDRIFHSAASLDLQRLGITLLELTSMNDTIQNMSHVIVKNYDDSNLT